MERFIGTRICEISQVDAFSLRLCHGDLKKPSSPALKKPRCARDIPMELASHKPMPAQGKLALGKPGLPAELGFDRRRVVEQIMFLFLSRQPGKPSIRRMVGRHASSAASAQPSGRSRSSAGRLAVE